MIEKGKGEEGKGKQRLGRYERKGKSETGKKVGEVKISKNSET